jgi:hypothetical protein
MIISHSDGLTYYSRSFNGSELGDFDPHLFGGLFSAIRKMGEILFPDKKRLATITYEGNVTEKIVVVSKERYFKDDSIYFVYFVSQEDGKFGERDLKNLSDAIFIDIKAFLDKQHIRIPIIRKKVNMVLLRKNMISHIPS